MARWHVLRLRNRLKRVCEYSGAIFEILNTSCNIQDRKAERLVIPGKIESVGWLVSYIEIYGSERSINTRTFERM